MDVILIFVLAMAQQAALEAVELEEFLRTAEVIAHEDIGIGVTRPMKLELSDGQVTLSASWKTVDERHRGIIRLADGSTHVNFRDSYLFELAAYELDKLIGTNLVPPTVKRRWRGESGAMQLWIENATTDFDRREQNIQVPDTPVEPPSLQHSALPVPYVRHRLQERSQHSHRSGLATLGHRQLALVSH